MKFKQYLIERLKNASAGSPIDFIEYKDELSIIISPANILEFCKFLKEDPELLFNMCEDVTAIDWAVKKNRFTVVYHLYSIKNNFRLRVKTNLEGTETESVTGIWESANWYERETFDMYGIVFKNHPDLRRMYMPEEFEYHPLRKEFPVMGIPGSLPLPNK